MRDSTGKQEWFPAWRAIILCPSHNGRVLGWKLFAAIVRSVSAMIHHRPLSLILSLCLFRFPLELWVRLNMNDLSIPKNQTAATFEFTSRIIFTFFIISLSFFALFSRPPLLIFRLIFFNIFAKFCQRREHQIGCPENFVKMFEKVLWFCAAVKKNYHYCYRFVNWR